MALDSMRHNETVKEALQEFKSRGEAGGAPFGVYSHPAPDPGISVSENQGSAACIVWDNVIFPEVRKTRARTVRLKDELPHNEITTSINAEKPPA